MFITLHGCLVEKLPGDKYKWNGFTGSKEEIEQRIKEAAKDLGNSLHHLP
jgi:hypothetical protein